MEIICFLLLVFVYPFPLALFFSFLSLIVCTALTEGQFGRAHVHVCVHNKNQARTKGACFPTILGQGAPRHSEAIQFGQKLLATSIVARVQRCLLSPRPCLSIRCVYLRFLHTQLMAASIPHQC